MGRDALAIVGIVFEDLTPDRALDAEPVVRVVGIDDQERELRSLANPVDLLAMRGHVHQDRVAVVVEPHRRHVDSPVAAEEPDDARDGSVEQLPVDRVELVERFDLLVIADRELLRLEPVGHIKELRHPNGHRLTPCDRDPSLIYGHDRGPSDTG